MFKNIFHVYRNSTKQPRPSLILFTESQSSNQDNAGKLSSLYMKLKFLCKSFSISLNPSLQLVSFFAEPYCHLLLLLRIIEEEAANLIVPIQNYRINCTNVSSQYTLLQRKYIVSTFAKLHLSLDEVFVQITVL